MIILDTDNAGRESAESTGFWGVGRGSAALLLCRVVGVVAVAFLSGCGGDGGGGDNPTAPAEYFLTFGGQITNGSGRTLREIELLLDGRSLRTLSTDSNVFAIPWLATSYASRGRHRFAVRVVRQSTSPTRYTVGGGVDGLSSSGAKVVDVNFPVQNVTVATGGSVEWEFSF